MQAYIVGRRTARVKLESGYAAILSSDFVKVAEIIPFQELSKSLLIMDF